MKINADFGQRVVVHSGDLDWIDSPMPGVARRPLDRVGAELARATTVVKYAPGSQFSPHTHAGGEEFLVLSGVFQDEHGDFPVGSYIRNPPQSSHTPGSDQGCTILVKLWQFDPQDRTHVRLQTHNMTAVADPHQSGIELIPLYEDHRECVCIQHWQPNAEIQLDATRGLEVFVLAGGYHSAKEIFRAHSWLRLPLDSKFNATAGPDGAKVWVKQNHLDQVRAEIEQLNCK